MKATVMHIEGRRRPDPHGVASLDDFILREGEPEDDAAFANFTPYCLDHARRRMIFVETSPATDLSAGPFYYQAQHQAAIRLLAVPYARVHELAEPIRPPDLVFIYSVARCGSTLVSKMWRQLDATLSLSEPDIFTDVNRLRRWRQLDDGEAARLLGSAVRLLFRPRSPVTRMVMKFRAPCLESADLLHQQWPQAKLVFMYRNAIAGVDSWVRVFGGGEIGESAVRWGLPEAALLGEEHYRRLGRIGLPLLLWAAGTQRYLRLRARGLALAGLRYEDLVEAPRPSVSAMFRHSGVAEELTTRALPAMDSDPQAGTALARNPDGRLLLTAEEQEQIRHFLLHHTGLAPDARLEGTLGGG